MTKAGVATRGRFEHCWLGTRAVNARLFTPTAFRWKPGLGNPTLVCTRVT
jgi:hypothetical protein